MDEPFPTVRITEKQCQPCSSLLAMGTHFYLKATYRGNKLYTLSLHFFYSDHARRRGYGVAWNAPPASVETLTLTLPPTMGLSRRWLLRTLHQQTGTLQEHQIHRQEAKMSEKGWMHTVPWRNIKENLPGATFLAAKILYLNKSLSKTKRI